MTSPAIDQEALRPAFDADFLNQLLARGIQVIRVIHSDCSDVSAESSTR
ncbi:hypothetical protein [Amycolatopsis plumensis]